MGRSHPSGISRQQDQDDNSEPRLSRAQINENAYKQGVLEATDKPIIFVDPDEIRSRSIGPHGRFPHRRETRADALEEQMERQVPGSTEALLKFMENGSNDDISLREMANFFRKLGPSALLGFNYEEHGLAVVPSRNYDSKKDIIRKFLDHKPLEFDRSDRRAVLENMPGTDAQWLRLIGNHEGAHADLDHDHDHDLSTNLGALIEETRADRVAMEMLRARGEDDMALAWKDLRSLSSRITTTHMTGPFLNNPSDEVTDIHYTAGYSHRENTDDYVEENFDFYSYSGKADTPRELLEENPALYFSTAQQGIDKLKAGVMEEYNEDPTSLDAQKAVVEAQIFIDYLQNFEDAYRRRVLGHDVPERAPTQLVTQEQENTFLATIKLEQRIKYEAFELRFSADQGEFSSGALFKDFDWDAYPGDATEWYQLDLAESMPLQLEFLEERKAEILEEYKANPSYENTERVLQFEKVFNDAASLTNFYERRAAEVSGADVPEGYQDVEFVSKEDRRAYYVERVAREDLKAEIGEVRQEHYLEARAWHTQDKIYANFDFDSYAGNAMTAEELLAEDPKAYYEHEAAYLAALEQEALDAYAADPSYDNAGRLLEVQHLIFDRYDAINIELDTIATEPRELLDTSPFVSEEVELEYYRERIESENDESALEEGALEVNSDEPQVGQASDNIDYQQGPEGTALTTEVAGLQSGEPDVDFESGVRVGDAPIISVFAQTADPDPEAVSVRSAKVDPDLDTAPLPPLGSDVSATQQVNASPN